MIQGGWKGLLLLQPVEARLEGVTILVRNFD